MHSRRLQRGVVLVLTLCFAHCALANNGPPPPPKEFDYFKCLDESVVLYNRTACTVCRIATREIGLDDANCTTESTDERCTTIREVELSRARSAFFAARRYCKQLGVLQGQAEDFGDQEVTGSVICELSSCTSDAFPEESDPTSTAKDCLLGLQGFCPMIASVPPED